MEWAMLVLSLSMGVSIALQLVKWFHYHFGIEWAIAFLLVIVSGSGVIFYGSEIKRFISKRLGRLSRHNDNAR
jgi:hypothetical protein